MNRNQSRPSSIKVLKQLFEEFVTLDEDNEPVVTTGKKKRADRYNALLQRTVRYIVNTPNYTNRDVMYYLTHPGITAKGTAVALNRNFHTVRSQVTRGIQKIAGDFNLTTIYQMIVNIQANADVKLYEAKLNQLTGSTADEILTKQLLINLNVDKLQPRLEVDSDIYTAALQTLKVYTKKQAQTAISEYITTEVKQYIKYLLTYKDTMDEVNQPNLTALLDALGM